MTSRQNPEDLVGAIYDAAVHPTRWPNVISDVASLIDCDSAALLFQDQVSLRGTGFATRVNPTAIQEFYGYYASVNPFTRGAAAKLAAMPDWRPRILLDRESISRTEFEASEYYNDFFRRYDAHGVVMIGLGRQGMQFGTLNILRPKRRDEFQVRDVEALSALHPHLIRAFDLSLELSRARRSASELWEALDVTGTANLIVDANGTIVHTNSAAEQMLLGEDGLRAIRGRIRAATAQLTRRLERLIIAATAPVPTERSGGAIALARPSGRRPYMASIMPFSESDDGLPWAPLFALMRVSEPDANLSVSERRLQELLGLSPAEARVAQQLMDGLDPKEIAAKLGISFFTVRSHLRRMYEKTQTNRQAQLVRLLLLTATHDIA